MAIKKQEGSGLLTGGLKTGGLETGKLGASRPLKSEGVPQAPSAASGGDSVFSEIANNYEAALSGSLGPEARFSTLLEVVQGEITASQNATVFSSSGGVKIVGFNGMYAVQGEKENRAVAGDESRRKKGKTSVAPWDLEITDAEQGWVRLVPGRVRKTMAVDGSGLVSVAGIGGEFNPSAGQLLRLEYTPSLDTALVLSGQWAGWPFPIDTAASSPPGLWVMTKGYYVLWEFVGSSSDPAALVVRTAPDGTPSLYAERRGSRDHLIFHNSWMEDKDGHVVPFYELVPG